MNSERRKIQLYYQTKNEQTKIHESAIQAHVFRPSFIYFIVLNTQNTNNVKQKY